MLKFQSTKPELNSGQQNATFNILVFFTFNIIALLTFQYFYFNFFNNTKMLKVKNTKMLKVIDSIPGLVGNF